MALVADCFCAVRLGKNLWIRIGVVVHTDTTGKQAHQQTFNMLIYAYLSSYTNDQAGTPCLGVLNCLCSAGFELTRLAAGIELTVVLNVRIGQLLTRPIQAVGYASSTTVSCLLAIHLQQVTISCRSRITCKLAGMCARALRGRSESCQM
jgi:hypothetical protein